jgi:N-acyl-D-aspartate/D-glutamate deacylase
MERIISKLTSIPASVYGIRRRGCIKEGYYADVVVMKDGAILDVFVNGVRSIREGVVERNLGGRTIYRS